MSIVVQIVPIDKSCRCPLHDFVVGGRPVGLSGPAALYDFIYGDQFTDEAEYMAKVYPTRRELEYTYVQKAGFWYDAKMIVYTVICILYAVVGKECTWILKEFLRDARESNPEIEVMPEM